MNLFIQRHDLLGSIKNDELEILLEEAENGELDLFDAIKAATEETASYIRHRYDETLSFIKYDYYKDEFYSLGNIVYLLAKDWAALVYLDGAFAAKDGLVYTALEDTLSTDVPGDSAKWLEIGKQEQFYKSIVAVTSGWPNDPGEWQEIEDPRNAYLRNLVVDISLYKFYSRINPRQIPEHRIKLREDSIDYLKRAADPRKNVTMALPLVVHEPQQGNDVSWISTQQRTNQYF